MRKITLGETSFISCEINPFQIQLLTSIFVGLRIDFVSVRDVYPGKQ